MGSTVTRRRRSAAAWVARSGRVSEAISDLGFLSLEVSCSDIPVAATPVPRDALRSQIGSRA